jgi:predicted nucleic acid-binding protein
VAPATKMILCDRNILIELYKNNLSTTQELRQIGQDRLALSAVTVAELYYGALNKTELQEIKQHLSLLHRFPIDTSISNTFLQLMETYSLSHNLGLPDALIAATSLVYEVELFTLNTRDFKFIPGLGLYQLKTAP